MARGNASASIHIVFTSYTPGGRQHASSKDVSSYPYDAKFAALFKDTKVRLVPLSDESFSAYTLGNMKDFIFDLRIVPERWLEFYRQPSATVVATTYRGQRVKFQARHLQRFVTRDGIRGTFRLRIDANNDFVSLEAL